MGQKDIKSNDFIDRSFYMAGKKFKSRDALVDLDNLKFDIEARTDLQKCKNQAEAYKQIISDSLTLKLANLIVRDGGVQEPLIVRKGQKKDELLVFDGCRRLAALKYLFKNGNKRINLRGVKVRLLINIDKEFVEEYLSHILVLK